MASKNYDKIIEELRKERSRREEILSGKTASSELAELQRRYQQEYLPQQASAWAKSLNDFQKKISADAQARSKGYQSQESLKAYQDSVSEQIASLKAGSKYAQEYARLSGNKNYIKSVTDSLGYLDGLTDSFKKEQEYWAQWANEDAYKKSAYYFDNTYAEAAKNYDTDVIKAKNDAYNDKFSGTNFKIGNGVVNVEGFLKGAANELGIAGESSTTELTDNEARMYAYIRDTVGLDEARRYIKSIQEDLSYRKGVKNANKTASMMGLITSSPKSKDAINITGKVDSLNAGLLNALSGLQQTTINILNPIDNDNVVTTPYQVYAHRARQENDTEFGKVVGDLAFTTGNMLPSIGVSAASKSPLLGAGITAMSSGGNAYSEARRQGYSHEQATAYGMINGALEGGLQYVLGGIGILGQGWSDKLVGKALSNLSYIKNAGARIAVQMGGKLLHNATQEAVEEGLQAILDPLVRSAVLQEDLNIDWDEVAYSAMLGAMSAGLWEGGSIVSNSTQANAIGKKAFENDSWQGAVDYALALDPNSTPYKLAKGLQDGSIKADGNNIGNLYSALVEYMQESKTLVRKGKMTTDQYVSGQSALQQIYEARSKAEAKNNAPTEISPNIMSARLYQEIKGLGLDEKTAIKYSNAITNLKEGTEVSGKITNELVSGNSPVKDIVARELGIDATNKTAAELRNAVKSYVDTVKSQPKTETVEQTAPKTEKELQYEQAKAATAELSKVLGEKGQAVYNEFSEGMRTGDSLMYFNNAVFDFYNQGVEASLKKNPPKKYTDIARYEGIAPIIKQRAFEAGKLDNATKAEAVKKTTEKVKSDIKEIKARQKELKHVEFDIKDLAPSAGKWTVDEGVDVNNLNEKQKPAFNYLKAVSEVSGINVHIMSGVNKNGELTAENGFYDSNTNTVYVSINAGAQSLTDITNTAVLKTASHEITHYIAATDTDAYQELRDYVVETFKKEHGEDGLARRVSEIQDIYLDQINKKLTYEKAIEEMVANACETMIRDSKVFSQLVRQNMTVAERLKDGLDRFITKMDKNRKAALEGIEETSLEARLIASNADTLKKAQKLWDNALKAAIKKNQEVDAKTESDGRMFEVRGYDFSKSFAEQIDDYKAGKFPRNDTLIVGGTPKVFQEIGLNPLPMTYAKGHLKEALANKNGDHLGEALLKKLPEALQNPLAIIDSASNPGKLVAIVEIQNHPRNVLAAVEVDGEGKMHGLTINSNAILTAHSRNNAISNLLKNAIISHAKGNGGLYYWQKNKAIKALQVVGVQFPSTQQIVDGLVRSITDPLSKVKRNFDSVTETKQFEHWFGDWQNNPRRASKVVNADGTPKIMYHGTAQSFTVFDRKKARPGFYGRGFYFTDSESHAKQYGNAMPVYLNIQNPLVPGQSKVNVNQIRSFLEAVAANEDYSIENYGENSTIESILQSITSRDAFDVIQDINATAIGDFGEAMRLFNEVNGTKYDGVITPTETIVYEPTQIKSASQSTDMKNIGTFDPTNPDIRYSLRYDETEFNARRELSTALLTVAQTDAERRSLEKYQKTVKTLNEQEELLGEMKDKLAQIDKAKEFKRYTELEKNIRGVENKINYYDSKLINLEATKPLKDIVARKEARLKEQFARSSTTRAKHRNSIKQKIRSLDQKLRSNSGEKHIISEFQPVVAKLLTACTNNTSVFKRAQLDRLKAIYEKFDPGEDNRRLKEHPELSEYMAKYAPIVAESIELITPILENRRLVDLDAETLAALDNVISGIHKMIVDADKVFAGNRVAQMRDISESSMVDAENSGFSRNTMTNTSLQAFFNYKNTLPVYVMERLGNTVMEYLWKPLENASYEMIREQVADTEFLQGKMKQHGYNSWKDKTLNIKLESGETIAMTQEQAMSIYALARREETHKGIGGKRINHLGIGGIIIPDIVKENIVDENGKVEKYLGLIPKKRPALNKTVGTPLTDADIAKIKKMLTTEQKAYVDDMVKYMSTVIAARGNAVSQKLYGIDIFTEEYYFPIVSDKNFLQTNFTGQAERLIKNAGMTKSLTENANNPIVVDDFSTVVAQHLQQMERYDTLAVPLDNFNRWLNYLSYDLDAEGNRIAKNGKGVKSTLEAVYGTNMTSYINQMLKDANANSIKGSNENFIDRLIGRFRKNAVLASLSVAIQQPSAMHRAHAYIDRKHFGYGFKTGWTHYHENLEEMLKYSGAAFVKEHGSFDPAVSNNAIDDMLFVTPEGWQKVLQMFNLKDATWRDRVLGTLPKVMDRITWVRIWNAVKNETKAKNPSMDVNSEEFLKKAGERFDYVINRTQVYDSVLSKSEYMRSKSTTIKALTSFGAEPTVAYNMLLKANTEMALAISKGEGKKTAGKFLARTIFAFLEASFVNALLKSLVTAARKDKPDDEDDKSYLEWYAHQLVNNFISDASPLGLLPVAREVQTLLEGYDLTNSQLDLLATMFDAVLTAADEDKPLEQKLEKIASAIGYAFGIPAENIIRDVGALINVYTDIANGWSTDWEGIKDAAQDGVAEATILDIAPESGNTADKLYKAMRNGDTNAYKQYYADIVEEFNKKKKAGKTDFKNAESYIRSQMRERLVDSAEIKAAYEASKASNFAEYDAAVKALTSKGFHPNDVRSAINSYEEKLKKGEASEPSVEEYEEEDVKIDKGLLVDAIANGKELEVIAEEQSKYKKGSQEYKDNAAKLKRYITQELKPQYQDYFLQGNTEAYNAIAKRLVALRQYGINYDADTLADWRKKAKEDRA